MFDHGDDELDIDPSSPESMLLGAMASRMVENLREFGGLGDLPMDVDRETAKEHFRKMMMKDSEDGGDDHGKKTKEEVSSKEAGGQEGEGDGDGGGGDDDDDERGESGQTSDPDVPSLESVTSASERGSEEGGEAKGEDGDSEGGHGDLGFWGLWFGLVGFSFG